MVKLKAFKKFITQTKLFFRKNSFLTFAVVLFVVFLGYLFFLNSDLLPKTEKSKDKYGDFIVEIYDTIQKNYWEKITEEQLTSLFKLSLEKSTDSTISAEIKSKSDFIKIFEEKISKLDESKKEIVVPQIAGVVLSSLNPPLRSGLYTQKLEQQLKNTVENINPEKDLYKDLELEKGASIAAVQKAYNEKQKELVKQDTPEAKEKLKTIAYAKEVLTENDKKQKYDSKGVEPTIFSNIYSGNILYIQFNKFSPTAFEEFIKIFENNKDNQALNALILDLRGNVGGVIDATSYFLGLFLGLNQYGYEFYHQGEYEPFKTTTDKLSSLSKYKQIVVLIDNQTQSSAEILAASLKKYRVGVLVGDTTKGWGTVERVFPLKSQITEKEKYSIFLVHSITLRDDNQPIEGRGVEPNISIKDSKWGQELFSYYRNQQLVNVVKNVL